MSPLPVFPEFPDNLYIADNIAIWLLVSGQLCCSALSYLLLKLLLC
jgi:hypothetical protein